MVTPRQACREAVALELGRECLELGIVPFLTKLVGETNVDWLFERHAGELPDEPPHHYDSFGHPCRPDCGVTHG